MTVGTEDLRTFAGVGHALWDEPARSRQAVVEALAAATLRGLPPEDALVRAAQALLTRATASRPGRLNHPFFRLTAEDRLLLVALHDGSWSYARLARILQVDPEKLEEAAWGARLRLMGGSPAGPARLGPSCPAYDARRPWTQRFLDDEIASGRERLFLQNHLMACDPCRAALGRCRDGYYAVERQVTEALRAPGGDADGDVEALSAAARIGARARDPNRVPDLGEAALRLLRKPEMVAAAVLLAVLAARALL
jgi:hypothetical protein